MSKAENYESDILNDLFEEITPAELKKVEKRMLLAQKISDGIEAKGWKKIDFARALDKRPSEITKWLSGTHNFNSDTLFDIEEVLGITLIETVASQKEQVISFNVFVSQNQKTTRNEMDFWVENALNTPIQGSVSLYSLSQDNISNCEYQA